MALGFGINPSDYRFGMPGAGPNYAGSVFGASSPANWTQQSPQSMQWPTTTGDVGTIGSQIGGPATGLGANLGTAQLALSGLATIGNLWAGMKQLKLAKQQFGFQRDFANANFANSIKSYNTSISDRSRARGFTEGQSQDQIQKYVTDNSLTDTRKKKGS